MAEKKKIEWLAVLQGFSMLLVVIGHVSLTNHPGDPSTPIATGIERVIYSFHMPQFIFISGWLFYYTCIRKEKTYKDVVISKLKRLGIPFFVFTLVATALKAAFPQLMHRPVTAQELINTFLLFRSNPLGEMWFVVVLLDLMLLYPLYCLALKQKWSIAILLIICITVYIFPLSVPAFYIKKVCHMAPFFVGGILCCKYEWHHYLEKYFVLGLSLIMFVLWNVLEIMPDPMKFISIWIGIILSFSLCLNVAKYLPQLFCSFRDYTFQIFLMGIFFQMVIRWVYVRIDNEFWFVPLWLLSVVIGIYVPTLIAKAIQKHTPKYMKLCFGLG